MCRRCGNSSREEASSIRAGIGLHFDGRGSVVVMLLLFLFWPQEWNTYELAAAMLLVANVVNHPHFAHSYQLFYSRFRSRALGRAFPLGLRVRYIFSGVVVPTVLVTFFAYCIWSGALNLIGYAANLMFFLVGWHYVKQGYGMLMLDAAFKRNFFSAAEKKFILWNCYVVWVTSWVLYNQIFSKGLYWNIKYAVFKIPHLIFQILAAATFLNFICLGLLFCGNTEIENRGLFLLMELWLTSRVLTPGCLLQVQLYF